MRSRFAQVDVFGFTAGSGNPVGMPAYAKDGKVICIFRNATKFKERYAMIGFNDSANLDQGAMWPVAYTLKELTAADEAKIRALVKEAVG